MNRYFALIPAAGSGTRMGLDGPKQYATLAGKPLIAHCLATLQAVPQIEKIFVVLAPGDLLWAQHMAAAQTERVVPLFVGGASRAMSVANGLEAVADQIGEQDWVLVHDAARACLTSAHVGRLIDALAAHPVGGLLAVPLADTLKRADDSGLVSTTVPRESLWQAQTPQMFRYALLRRALRDALDVTDESSAIEAAGLRPLLVEGDVSNFKVTRALDLQMAQWVLENRDAKI